MTVYTVSEERGTVQLTLLKVGEISSDIVLQITTLASTATGKAKINVYIIHVYVQSLLVHAGHISHAQEQAVMCIPC